MSPEGRMTRVSGAEWDVHKLETGDDRGFYQPGNQAILRTHVSFVLAHASGPPPVQPLI